MKPTKEALQPAIMSNRTEDTENERLRAEIRHLRALLAAREETQALSPSTERQRTEQALDIASVREEAAQSARLFDVALSALVDFVFTFDRAGRFTYVNQSL